jgi:hypothetical protein
MSRTSAFARFGVMLLVLAGLSAALWAGAAQASGTVRFIECQHPLRTGEEVYDLVGITAKAACPVVIDLGHWEYAPGHVTQHITELYRCGGAHKRFPALKLRAFEGWQLSLTKIGEFRMSRGASSFLVTGTDFPLNCT